MGDDNLKEGCGTPIGGEPLPNTSGESLASGSGDSLPSEISMWTKVKNFLLQDVTVTMTPYQEKVLQEVHDFWFQDVNFGKVKDFLFQEVSFKSKKTYKVDV